jgi:hypothetical protein
MWPTQWFDNFKTEFLDAYPKTAGLRVIKRYGLYVLIIVMVPFYGQIIRSLLGLCRKRPNE